MEHVRQLVDADALHVLHPVAQLAHDLLLVKYYVAAQLVQFVERLPEHVAQVESQL